jgi:hypothetical protein
MGEPAPQALTATAQHASIWRSKVLAKGKNLIKDMEELYRTQRAMMAYLLVDVD